VGVRIHQARHHELAACVDDACVRDDRAAAGNARNAAAFDLNVAGRAGRPAISIDVRVADDDRRRRRQGCAIGQPI
jgi:hypothetical protein